MIQVANPGAENSLLIEDINTAIAEVLREQSYILGNNVKKFEKSLAQHCKINYAIGVANGTDALFLSLKALNIGHGDEVITTCHTALATIAAIVAVGATPVIVDINNEMLIDVEKVRKAVTRKTKAIIAVHLYGLACDMDVINEIANNYKLSVIEDCAQAFGTTYKGRHVGVFSDLATFSFYPTKNLGAIGDGGAVITKSSELHYKLTLLRQYGWDNNRVSQIEGYNSRLDEIQAAILNVKLNRFTTLYELRRKIAMKYINELVNIGDLELPTDTTNSKHSYHLFVIKTSKRDELKEHLQSNKILCGIHYAELVNDHPGYTGKIKYNRLGKLSCARETLSRILSLPIYPGLDANSQIKIISTIKDFYSCDRSNSVDKTA